MTQSWDDCCNAVASLERVASQLSPTTATDAAFEAIEKVKIDKTLRAFQRSACSCARCDHTLLSGGAFSFLLQSRGNVTWCVELK